MRPTACPKDDTPCVGVVYTVAEAKVECEWTVVPPDGGKAAMFLDQNAEASRYFVRQVPTAEVVGLVVSSAQPVYPPIARAAHVSGPVTVRVIVGTTGAVEMAVATSGPEMLRASSADAAKKWKFRSLQVGTQASPFTTELHAVFALKEDPSNCVKTDKGNICAKLPDITAAMQP